MSNIVFATFGNHLIRNQIRNGLKLLILSNSNKSLITFKRFINTSDKKKDSLPSYSPEFMEPQPKGPKTVKEFADVESQKNWISYGWDIGNMENDRSLNRWGFFVTVTVFGIIAPYIVMYYPDYNLKDWATREAYLEVDRRERLGLPYIDRNLVDPNLLELPSDEELGETDIYI